MWKSKSKSAKYLQIVLAVSCIFGTPVWSQTDQTEKALVWQRPLAQGIELKNSGRYQESEGFLKEALAKADDSNSTSDQRLIILVALAGTNRFMRHYAESIKLYEKVLALLKQQQGDQTSPYAMQLDNLAQVYAEMKDSAKAVELQKQALAIFEKNKDPEYAPTLVNYAATLLSMDNIDEAEKNYQKAIDLFKDVPSRRDSDMILAAAYDNLGSIYTRTQRFEKAEETQKKALELFKTRVPLSSPDITICVSNLAQTLVIQNKTDEAKKLIDEHKACLTDAQAEQLKTFLAFHTRLSQIIAAKQGGSPPLPPPEDSASNHDPEWDKHMRAATNAVLMNAYEKAIPSYEAALKIAEKKDPNSKDTGTTLMSLGGAYLQLEQKSKAEAVLKRALPIYEKNYPPDSRYVKAVKGALALATSSPANDEWQKEALKAKDFLTAGNDKEALATFEKSLTLAKSLGGWKLGFTLFWIGTCQLRLGQFGEAEKTLTESLPLLESGMPKDSQFYTDAARKQIEVAKSKSLPTLIPKLFPDTDAIPKAP